MRSFVDEDDEYREREKKIEDMLSNVENIFMISHILANVPKTNVYDQNMLKAPLRI
jgi:hypothetical protein